MSLTTNVHLESQTKTGSHSCSPCPSPEGHTHQADHSAGKKSIPNTGWCDSPPIPSCDGSDSEKDWMLKLPYNWSPVCGPDSEELFKTKYESSCWCSAVHFAFLGDPFDAKHCHCRQCQWLHSAPFQWVVIFPKTSVRILENNSDALHCFSTTTKKASHHVPCKVSCDICWVPLFDEGKRMVLAYPSHYGGVPLEFQPSCHIFYGQRIMEVYDGIPKWRGHKDDSELMQEMSNVSGVMPRYKGYDEGLHP
ncbi:Mss4-like protein [Suillus subaureus]|uniref:Mss4-like protein n=1 Tax=Suillus subaureus TaxID=48587 RepID=A0A9P7EGH3_9AGAM|nr:Mss4-like protein [Suillus subaureus]KAG1821122.1 Mss4-like protein [Suillus subaureus]